MTRFKLTYRESERGWGSSNDYKFCESYDSAWENVKSNLDANPPGPAPDYYYLIVSVEEEVASALGGTSWIDVTEHFFEKYRENNKKTG